jgi:cation:H+ antiporter
LLIAAEGIVRAASFFSQSLNLPLSLVGILIVGLGNAIPETYFAIMAARRAQNWMILGDLMGSVIIAATMVLGIVALIYPIEIVDFSPFAIARFFLIISAMFFLFFVRTDKKISKKEAIFLLLLYITFVTVEILTK